VSAAAVATLQEMIREGSRLLPVGGGTKPALSGVPADSTALELSALRGILEYDPAELTFTAMAATPLSEIEGELAEHGQWLPFDPPLARSGATLGGAVASGIAGPGGFGSGAVRDFVVGVKVIDGQGRVFSGGGRVVKNAAGFDLPKLMVGSAGRLGVIVEVCCKVFPKPASYATVVFETTGIEAALAAIAALSRSPIAIEALELEPPGRVSARLAGSGELLGRRARRLAAIVPAPSTVIEADEEADLWRGIGGLEWAPGGSRVVVAPQAIADVPALERALAPADPPRRYSLGANAGWIAWPTDRPPAELSDVLSAIGLRAIALTGPPLSPPLLGAAAPTAFGERVRDALDPQRRFLEIWP
jgi:glycolate oxidase FAD binding subunit